MGQAGYGERCRSGVLPTLEGDAVVELDAATVLLPQQLLRVPQNDTSERLPLAMHVEHHLEPGAAEMVSGVRERKGGVDTMGRRERGTEGLMLHVRLLESRGDV